jgi:hypothetical protein
VAEVERPAERRVERVEQTRQEDVVAGLLDDDSHRAELLPERAAPLGEGAEPVWMRHLDREAKTVGCLLGPVAEPLLVGQSITRRVQLDRVEVLRIRAQKLALGCPGRVEAGLPGRIREA